LLAAFEASEARRHRRKRDPTPDAIGVAIKRQLLEAVMKEDPDPERFEAWLWQRCIVAEVAGPLRAMAESVLAEWRLALESEAFRFWLAGGAPSDDARDTT
jgi:hypothetical protein